MSPQKIIKRSVSSYSYFWITAKTSHQSNSHQIRAVVQLFFIPSTRMHLSWRYLPIVFINRRNSFYSIKIRFLDHHRLLLRALYLQKHNKCVSIFIEGLYLCCSFFFNFALIPKKQMMFQCLINFNGISCSFGVEEF